MKVKDTAIQGVKLVSLEERRDERGSLTKIFDRPSFESVGMQTCWDQTLVTDTSKKGTIRGMHWQSEPLPEIKLIRCGRGRIFDVLVDVRPDSASFGKWESFILSENEPLLLYAPEGVAHGFQALEDNVQVMYHISGVFDSGLQCGFNCLDDEVGIGWPLQCEVISERDEKFPRLSELDLFPGAPKEE